ncbi:GNAT family N-acetyltransferase [Actinomycetospora sp. TBRC 11914]|uniref:GNAT family N-acetyltransferase n=1 Tax=Actinomycetospora sp. TBRC 11914 TaxID=2729387 RepID=UPI00145FA65E|nr:GNAT family N-acetyltransferase [Actinomycetospora sp. TBRC 11914]NMO90667.1 GNAT family N-acetyltransferase [Actinomycetospora sp. TBRC 11914]
MTPTLTRRPAVAGPVSRDVWDEVFAADPDAVATQSPEWMDALRGRGYRDASRLYALADDRRLVLPLAARRRAGVTVSEESWPYGWGYGGALVEGGDLTVADARLVLDDLRARPAVLRGLTPMPLRGAVWEQAAAATGGVQRVPYTSQVVDLGVGWDRLWESGFKRQARNSVRKAERFDLDVRREDGTTAVGPDGRGLAVFRDLYAQSVDRWAAQRGQPLALARRLAARRDRPGQVAAAAAALGERCVVWSVLRDGEPVAANVVLVHRRHALGWMCAMDTTGIARETLATYLLHSLAIRDACERGVRWFHMGESDAGSGPEHFKRYFGAVPVEYAALRFERLPLSRAEQAARRVYAAVSRRRSS